jgi:hypothetical protein
MDPSDYVPHSQAGQMTETDLYEVLGFHGDLMEIKSSWVISSVRMKLISNILEIVSASIISVNVMIETTAHCIYIHR